MDDLISRAGLLRQLGKYCIPEECGMLLLYKSIMQIPSAEPEIVRCKDCKHRHIENDVWVCPFGLPGGPEFCCAYGAERRDDVRNP